MYIHQFYIILLTTIPGESGKMMGLCDNEIRKGHSYLQKLSQPYVQYLPVGIQMTFDVGSVCCDGSDLLFFYGEVCLE